MPIPIVLDCDVGHDDAIAILLALSSSEVELRAVTAVAGNAPLHHTAANAIRVLDHAGRSFGSRSRHPAGTARPGWAAPSCRRPADGRRGMRST